MKYSYLIFCFFTFHFYHSQNVDIENITKPKFSVSGGINANSVFFSSNQVEAGRDPFTYMLSGNLNINAFTFNMPISYSFTNMGSNLGYTMPFNFNRLALTPKYKWVKAYIGDASMTFSPYTLSGHPFRGLGLELTPEKPYQINLMAGQLLNAVEFHESPNEIPVFRRMGYGTKFNYDFEKIKLEWITFFAKDDIKSIEANFDKFGVTPKQNIVNSLGIKTSIINNLEFSLEYAFSILTNDTRSQNEAGFLSNAFSLKDNTSYLKALRSMFDYTIGKSKIGIGYEKVDPNYQTLGALFFNNDMENITLNFARPFLKDKISIATSLGYQRDDLNAQKQQNTKRTVGSINVTYQVTEQFNISGNYSNLSTFTNRRFDPFEVINNEFIQPSDTLNYRQLSQNANVNLAYTFGKDKNQNMNFNYTIAGQANEQGGVIRKGQASNVQNYNLTHAINFKETGIALSTSANYTLNQAAGLQNSAAGGSVMATKKLFKEKLNTSLGMVHNQSSSDVVKNNITGLKCNAAYTLFKKHNLSLNSMFFIRKMENLNAQTNSSINDLTVTFNYAYSF